MSMPIAKPINSSQSHPAYFGRVEVMTETSNGDNLSIKLSIVDNFSFKRVNIELQTKATEGVVEVWSTLNEVYFNFRRFNNASLLLYAYVHSEEVSLSFINASFPFTPTIFQALYTIEQGASGAGWSWNRVPDAQLTIQQQEGGSISAQWSHWEEWSRPASSIHPNIPLPLQSGAVKGALLACTQSSAFIVRTLEEGSEGSSILEW